MAKFKVELDFYSSKYDEIKNIAKARIADYEANVDNGYVEDGEVEEVTNLYTDIAGNTGSTTYRTRHIYSHTGSSTATGTVCMTGWGMVGFKLTNTKYTEGENEGKYKVSLVNFGSTYEGYYELTPIAENYGKIQVYTNYSGGFFLTGIKGYFEGWYVKYNGEYVLRVYQPSQDGTYWHPWDMTKDNSTFKTWNVFDALAGNAKEAGEPTYKTYTDASGANLTLENSGAMTNNGAGFELMLNGADSAIIGSYDFIALDENHGKIMLLFNGRKNADTNKNYSDMNSGITKTYVMGDYKKYGDGYVISFEHKEHGKFIFTSGAKVFDGIKTELAGAYAGSNALTINAQDITDVNLLSATQGTFKVGETIYNFNVMASKILLTTRISGKDVVFFK